MTDDIDKHALAVAFGRAWDLSWLPKPADGDEDE